MYLCKQLTNTHHFYIFLKNQPDLFMKAHSNNNFIFNTYKTGVLYN